MNNECKVGMLYIQSSIFNQKGHAKFTANKEALYILTSLYVFYGTFKVRI